MTPAGLIPFLLEIVTGMERERGTEPQCTGFLNRNTNTEHRNGSAGD